MLKHCLIYLFLFLLVFPSAYSQEQPILSRPWEAYWISVPRQPLHDYGVYQFRKSFTLTAKPASFLIHVSADNRYKLYVNGTLVSLGPARGDIFHWNYETVDIATYLKDGINTIAALVWNFGDLKPEAQISYQTAFILQGDGEKEKVVNTGKDWKCRRDSSYSPNDVNIVYSYYVAGPGETIDYNKAVQGWRNSSFNDASWQSAEEVSTGLPKGVFGFGLGWMLVPRSIPQMELTPQRLQRVRRASGITIPGNFPSAKVSFNIPAHTTATILLDQGFETDAYPVLTFSKGKNATITLGYAEALYIDDPSIKDWRALHQKGDRDSIDGKIFIGVKDSLVADGSDDQQFTTLWWRTYRYMQLTIQTKEESLTINDLYGIFTGYPFKLNARFEAGNDTLDRILETGWRTARSCAQETYMDCPYYEQLQYVGDTRIQALVSLYNSGDDRLMRNAISLIDDSRMAEGATLSRYPTANAQEIPPFSLWWIGMLHDYWMYRNDDAFVKNKLPGLQQVLSFFHRYQQADGSLKNTPYWNFTDWCETKGWNAGVAPIGKDGNSAILDLQLLWAYQLAAELETHLGMKEFALTYQDAAKQLKETIQRKYWDDSRKLFADTDDKDVFSQHANALAIITGVVEGQDAAMLGKRIIADTSLTEATIYFKYYVYQALAKAGYGNDYLNWLGIWKKNLAMGMTTWAEISDINNTRSDCHAWGASPNIELYRIVLGIDSDAPGFRRIKIVPHLGSLTRASGKIPHPAGEISVRYEKDGRQWNAAITLPKGTSGYLEWQGKQYVLNAGMNSLRLP